MLEALVGAVVGSVLASVLAYAVWRRQTQEQDERQRVAIASALLVEIREIDAIARRLYNDPNVGSVQTRFRTRALEQFAPYLHLFDSAVAVYVMRIAETVVDLHELFEPPAASVTRLPANHAWAIRAKALFATELIAGARTTLVRAGGVEPPMPPDPELAPGQLRPLPGPLPEIRRLIL